MRIIDPIVRRVSSLWFMAALFLACSEAPPRQGSYSECSHRFMTPAPEEIRLKAVSNEELDGSLHITAKRAATAFVALPCEADRLWALERMFEHTHVVGDFPGPFAVDNPTSHFFGVMMIPSPAVNRRAAEQLGTVLGPSRLAWFLFINYPACFGGLSSSDNPSWCEIYGLAGLGSPAMTFELIMQMDPANLFRDAELYLDLLRRIVEREPALFADERLIPYVKHFADTHPEPFIQYFAERILAQWRADPPSPASR